MFAGPRLDRQPTVTQFCGVGAIRPEFATEQQQPSAPCCIFVSLKMAGSRGDPARGRLVDRSVFSFISADPQAIECTRPGSVPIQGLRQPWTGTDRRCRLTGSQAILGHGGTGSGPAIARLLADTCPGLAASAVSARRRRVAEPDQLTSRLPGMAWHWISPAACAGWFSATERRHVVSPVFDPTGILLL
jgi:hypothetical protein